MCGAIPLLPRITSWRVQGQLYVFWWRRWTPLVYVWAELVVAGCEALSRHWNLMIVDIPAEIRATHPRIRPRSVSTLRQQRFSCGLIYQTGVPFCLSVGGVSEKRANRIVHCMFSVQMRSAIQVHYGTFVSFCSKFLPWTAASSLEVWYWNFGPFLIAASQRRYATNMATVRTAEELQPISEYNNSNNHYVNYNMCNENQQNAHFFSLMIKFNYSVFDMFRTSKCSSLGRLVHAVLWYIFMCQYKQSGRWQYVCVCVCVCVCDTTVCPIRYRTRHFFNNSYANEDIATKQTHTLQTHSSSFLTQRTYSCSNFVAISSLVLELLRKCRVR